MLADGEKYAKEDAEIANKVDAKNNYENYVL